MQDIDVHSEFKNCMVALDVRVFDYISSLSPMKSVYILVLINDYQLVFE